MAASVLPPPSVWWSNFNSRLNSSDMVGPILLGKGNSFLSFSAGGGGEFQEFSKRHNYRCCLAGWNLAAMFASICLREVPAGERAHTHLSLTFSENQRPHLHPPPPSKKAGTVIIIIIYRIYDFSRLPERVVVGNYQSVSQPANDKVDCWSWRWEWQWGAS